MTIESQYKPLRIPSSTVTEFVFASGRERTDVPVCYPSHVTERAESKPLTSAQVEQNATALANALLAHDAEGGAWKKGEVMLFYAENQHDFLQVSLGVIMAGGIPALLNPQYKASELVHVLEQVKPRALVVTKASLTNAKEAFQSYGSQIPFFSYEADAERSYSKLIVRGKELMDGGAAAHKSVSINPESDTAIYCFSSGTSGLPKVVRLSHTNIVANIIQATVLLGGRVNKPTHDPCGWYDQPHGVAQDGTNELHVSFLPQFHCYGLIMALVSLHTATPNVIFSRFDVEHILQSIELNRATFMFVVPPIGACLLTVLALATVHTDKYDLSSLKSVASGAASLSYELRALLRERRGICVTDGYGMTESVLLLTSVADYFDANSA